MKILNRENQNKIRDEAIEILRILVGFDTTSRNSNLEIINWVQNYLEKYGANCHLVYNDEKTKANLIAFFGEKQNSGGIIFSGHSDVVPIDDQEWETDPWELTQKNGKLYGRGTADMKAFSACFLAFVPYIANYDFKSPICFAFSYDEEIGCLGAPRLVDFLVQNMGSVEAVVVGEPTNMKIVSGHKAISTFNVEITGHEAHSSRIDMGVSAIMEAIPLMNFLNELGHKFRPQDSIYTPSGTTITIGLIEGGTAINILAHHCRFSFDIRNEPDFPLDDLIKTIENEVAKIDAKIKLRAPMGGAKITIRSKTPGLKYDKFSNAEQLIRELTGDNEIIGASYAAEAGIFQSKNMPVVICGPGSILQAHQPNEFIEISQIEQCLNFLSNLFDKKII